MKKIFIFMFMLLFILSCSNHETNNNVPENNNTWTVNKVIEDINLDNESGIEIPKDTGPDT